MPITAIPTAGISTTWANPAVPIPPDSITTELWNPATDDAFPPTPGAAGAPNNNNRSLSVVQFELPQPLSISGKDPSVSVGMWLLPGIYWNTGLLIDSAQYSIFYTEETR